MARINYADKAARTRQRYLYPEEDRTTLSNVAIPALSLLMFATPLGGKLLGGAISTITKPIGKAIARAPGGVRGVSGLAKHGARELMKSASSGARGISDWWKNTAGKRASMISGASNWVEGKGKWAFNVVSGSEGNLFPGASNAVRFIGKHPGKIALGAGAFGALSAMAPRPEKQPIADIGMGYPQGTTWVRRDGKPLRPGHLGATGDLVFALRDGR